MLRIVVAAPPVVRAPADLARLPAAADVVELRLDLLPGALDETALPAWVRASPRPVLATVRSAAEGGAFRGGPAEAARWLATAARAGAAWVDAERDVVAHLEDLPPAAAVVASLHGDRPVDLPRRAAGREVARRKVARPVADAAALARLRAEAAAAGPATTLVPYGPLGAIRAAFVAHEGALLYGAAAPGAEVTAGQPPLLALLDELRAGEVSPKASLYGLLGRPPAPSPSPALHNAVFRAQGRDALHVPLGDLALPEALGLPFEGYSVTTPWKEEAARLADARAAEVDATGAANTLVRTDGRWFAANTDVGALASAVADAAPGEEAFVYGAGGYARAAVVALRGRGYAVRLGARDAARGAVAARALGVPWAGLRFERRARDRVLANATPAGADGAPPEALAEPDLAGLDVLDAPYAVPGRATGLAEAARRGGAARVVDGLDLLLRQATEQARWFGGRPAPPHVLALALRPCTNLVLVGLRGAGKTTVGRLVARALGRPFLDLDEEVARLEGFPSAGALLRARGIPAFREAEARAVARLSGRRGLVVGAGGGALETPANVAVLGEAAFGVWLDLPPETAAARVVAEGADRPPLQPGADPVTEAREIRACRAPAWARFAQVVLPADRPPEQVAASAGEAWVRHARP